MQLKSFLGIFIIIPTVVPLIQGVHVERWHKFDDSQLIFIETEPKYNWHKAWDECALRNMSLLIIDSSEKSNALMDLLNKVLGKSQNLWIGGNDLGEEGTFIWHTTGKRFEFTNWKKGNPDNSGGDEACVHMCINTNYEWNDAKCIHKMGFICEPNQMLAMERKEWQLKKQVVDRLFEL